MHSLRSPRRQPQTEEKVAVFEQRRLLNQLGQVVSLPAFPRKSRQRDRRYARDIVGQSVVEWLHDSQKPSKKKQHSRKQSLSPNSKHHSNQHPAQTSTVPIHRSLTTVRTTKKPEENQSSFPMRITNGHLIFQKHHQEKDGQSSGNIPQTFSTSAAAEDKQCCCQVVMTYQTDTILSLDLHHIKRDEVTVYQELGNGSTFVIFRGFLKAGDVFSFKSQRSIEDRFQLIICVNDLINDCLSVCCEYKYQDGIRIGGDDGLFWIQNIDGARPCKKCLETIDTSFQSHSSSSKRSASLIPRISSQVRLPLIHKSQSMYEKKAMLTTKSDIDNGTNESGTFHTQQSYTDTDEHRALHRSSRSSVSPATNNQLASTNLQWPVPRSTRRSSSASSFSRKSDNIVRLTKTSSASETTLQNEVVKDEEYSALSSEVQTTVAQIPVSWRTPSELSSSIQRRMIGDVESFVIAWMSESNEDEIITLRSVVNIIRVLDDIDALNQFLSECPHSKVIVLLSYDNAHSLIHRIHAITSVCSIYLLSMDHTKRSDWTKDYHKIVGIHRTTESVCDHLRQTLLPISFTTLIPVITTRDSTADDTSFVYQQLLKETMLCRDEEGDLKRNLIEFCRLHYADNPDEMRNIDEFESEFIPQRAIWWFTRNCFISKMLTRALHTEEVDLLFKMRFFMQCLRAELDSILLNENITVYTSLALPFDNVLNLQKNINGLLLFNAYLPAMFQQPTSADVASNSKEISVMFSIKLGSNCGTRVNHFCAPDFSIDVLINIDILFRIRSVEKVTETQWNVNLESIRDTDPHFQELTGFLRNTIEAPVVLLQLTKLLLATNRYAECDYLAELVYTDGSLYCDPTLLASLAAVHHLLGNVDDEKEDPVAARKQFFKSLRAFQTFLSPNHPMMSASYNNIGSMYFKENEYNEAIKFHQQALECQLKSPSPDTDAIATYSNNIGAVYFEQAKYWEALKHLQRAATILERLPSTAKLANLCIIYQKIAASYWRMDKAKEALEYYKKTLELQLTFSLPSAHQISVTYFNLSTAYARLGQIDEAVSSAEKSVEELLKIYPLDHSEVKENQAQLEIVRQKQWLQQVLSN